MVTKELLKSVRQNLGETQAVFGARFGVDQSTVHRWEELGVTDRGTTRMAVQRVLSEVLADHPEIASDAGAAA